MPRLPGVEPSEQIVCHVDMDCFYAACERLREPTLRGKPVVVGMGYEPGETHGAVATASYDAREYGVESAMAISEALERLPCKENSKHDTEAGYYRPVDMSYYESISDDVQSILQTSAETVREVSIDEAYLRLENVSWSGAAAFGRSLKEEIEATVGVVASIGIAPDMTTAKLASDADKPDGLVVIEPETVRSFLAPIAVEELHGVGPVTASELREMGFRTAGDIGTAEVSVFVDAFGERGKDLYAQARGEDDRTVEPKGNPKSISSESAFVEPTVDSETKQQKLRTLAGEVTERATAKGILYRTIGIKVVTPPFEVSTRSRSLSGPIHDSELVAELSLDLLSEFEGESVRKLGVRLSNLSFDNREQATIGEWTTETSDETNRFEFARDTRQERIQAELSRFD